MDSHCYDKASKDFKGNVFERVKMQAVMTKVLSFVCYTTYFYINVVLSLGSTKIKLNKAMMITDNETAIDFCRVRKGSCEIKKIKKHSIKTPFELEMLIHSHQMSLNELNYYVRGFSSEKRRGLKVLTIYRTLNPAADLCVVPHRLSHHVSLLSAL